MDIVNIDMIKNRYENKPLRNLLYFQIQNQRQFANIVTGDDTFVNFFEPLRKIGNKIWLIVHGRWPVVAK